MIYSLDCEKCHSFSQNNSWLARLYLNCAQRTYQPDLSPLINDSKKSAQLCIIYEGHKFHWFPSCLLLKARGGRYGEKNSRSTELQHPRPPVSFQRKRQQPTTSRPYTLLKMSSLTNSSSGARKRSLSFASSRSHLYAPGKNDGWRKLFLHLINSHYWNNSARAVRSPP